MITTAKVNLWGRQIGAVSWDVRKEYAFFEYTGKFQKSGIEVSPLMMPLSDTIYSFAALPKQTFHGLPGLLADSLPDKYGNALIDTWLATQGRIPASFTPVERLCYIGQRGMGALEFAPAILRSSKSKKLDLAALVDLASKILTHREAFSASLSGTEAETMQDILRVGTSAGGARAKALIAWNRTTNEVRSGQVTADPGFTYWLLKFDGVSNNKDKELADPKGFGLIEYAYYLMASDAGIEMTESRILPENGRHHFMTKRFDRTDDGGKLHMQSLCGMKHFDFNQPDFYSYEQALQVISQLGLGAPSLEQQFRRVCFNIVARNQDDHVKNIAFLMDKSGMWSLSPAFDLSYSYNPTGDWTSQHQLSMNGKRDNFVVVDFVACGEKAILRRARALEILDEVVTSVQKWPTFAEKAGVGEDRVLSIQKTHRLL
ncbi:MAG: type II toxin-antitoxin system HipA family toxin [Candidatus Melainabacteria bacterium]|nr:type II toxin-antitoxin system HipA family toxin [Candidatus Melainabacteria bacterium]